MALTPMQVKNALDKAGKATWTVLPDGAVEEHGLGRLPPPADAPVPRTRNVSRAIATARASRSALRDAPSPQPPPLVDWRNHHGFNATTPVKNQGLCGSCVSFGTIALIESMLLVERGLTSDLSEAEFAFCAGGLFPGGCGGWYEDFAIRRARTDGAGDELLLPYSGSDHVQCPVVSQNQRVRANHDVAFVTDASRKRYLNEVGPMVACFDVYEDFRMYQSGVYQHVIGPYVGGHCVEVIGYDDVLGCWIAKNSWGTGWGEAGFFRIRYGQCNFESAAFRGLSGFVLRKRVGFRTVAFQANTGNLWTVGVDNRGDWELGMKADTSPSITALPGGGYEVAFQANTGNLWTVGVDNRGDWELGMKADTSPSITALPGGGYEVAFQANTGNLWTVGVDNHGDWELGMKPDTSPSITALPGGGHEVAFQANTGNLWLVGADNRGDTGLGMKAGTSPSITALPGGGYEVAFQANTGNLWTVGVDNRGDWELGMKPDTSPSITALPSGGHEVAFQANTGNLWLVGADNRGDTGLGIKAGTSPSITALPGGGYEVAFHANTGNLWTVGVDNHGDWELGMRAGANPSLAV